MLTLKSFLAGSGAVVILYVAVVLYIEGRYMVKGIVTGLAVPPATRLVLMYPAFWLAAVAAFLAAAYWATRSHE